MKLDPRDQDGQKKESFSKKKEKGFRVDLWGFETRWEAMKHLVEINRGNNVDITGIKFSVQKNKEGYHIVFAFMTVDSVGEANKMLLNYLTRKISRDYV